jgi:integrase
MKTEKKDIYDSPKAYEQSLDRLKKDISKENYEIIKRFLSASALGRTAKKGVSKKIAGVRARTKNLYLLKTIAKYLDSKNIVITKMNLSNMENLILAIQEDQIVKEKGGNYSDFTKVAMKKVLIQLLRFNLGQSSKKFDELTSWVEVIKPKKEIKFLKEEEVLKLMEHATDEEKAQISVLFDSGARAEEFLNLRYSDFEEIVEEENPYFRLTIRAEFSKTEGRTLSLAWGETYPVLKAYLIENPGSPEDIVFDLKYDALRMRLKRLGQKVLGKDLTAHTLRRSSATFFSGKGMAHGPLTKRYGWSITSQTPELYISKSGFEDKKFVQQMNSESIWGVKQNLQKVELENQKLKGDIAEFKSFFNEKVQEITQIVLQEHQNKIAAMQS